MHGKEVASATFLRWRRSGLPACRFKLNQPEQKEKRAFQKAWGRPAWTEMGRGIIRRPHGACLRVREAHG